MTKPVVVWNHPWWAPILACLCLAACNGSTPSGPAAATLPTPTPTPPPVIPSLLAPTSGASLSNDCSGDAWEFDWSDIEVASGYHLQVVGPDGATPIDEEELTESAYTWTRPSLVEEAARDGWRWRVRARVGGEWMDWSQEEVFHVDPLYPTLLSPEDGATMDNSCYHAEEILWDFDWSDCLSADRYHLHVMGPTATIPLIDNDRIRWSAHAYSSQGYIADQNRRGWRWRVRARLNGTWRAWSPERSFDVELLNTDCPSAAGLS